MASKKVIVNIKVTQDGAKVSDVTKDVKKLTDAEKERIALKKKEVDLLAQEKIALKEKLRIQKNSDSIDKQRSKVLISNTNALNRQKDSTIQASNAQELLNQNLQQFKTTSGLSGAIVTEFGRTISDLPFGIRGVGNNLAQLGSLFGSLAVNATKAGGGIKDAIGQILISFKGIVGFITIFQVFIALLQTEFFQKFLSGLAKSVGALDLFKDKLKDIKDVLKEASQTAGTSIGNFRLYTRTIQDSNASLESQQEALKRLNEEYPDYDSSILTSTDSTKNATLANDLYIKSLTKRAISQAAITKFNEQQAIIQDNLLKRNLAIREDKGKTEKKLDKERADINKRLSEVRIKIDKNERDRVKEGARRSEIGEANNNLLRLRRTEKNLKARQLIAGKALSELNTIGEKEINEAKKIQEIIIKDIDFSELKKTKLTKESSERRVKEFREGRFSLERELQRSENELLKNNSRTNLEIIEDDKKSSSNLIEIKTNEFIVKEELRLADFVSQKELDLKRKGISEGEKKRINESIENAVIKTEKTISLAEKEAQGVIAAIDKVASAREENEINRARIQRELNEGGLSIAGQQGDLDNLSGEIARAEAQQSLDTLVFETKKNNLESLIELEKEGTQTRIDLENRLNLLKISNESKEIKNARIVENSKVNLAKNSALALADILGRQSKEGKIAAATAATINTYQGISNALKTGVAPFKYVDAGITAAKGFAAVRNILSTNAPSSSDSSGSTVPNIQPPDFNIIGSTGVNQLADAIGSTTDQPVKAFVVSSDITNQQALDRSINESAQI